MNLRNKPWGWCRRRRDEWRDAQTAVIKALDKFIGRHRRKSLLKLVGKLEWDETFDYKAERTRL